MLQMLSYISVASGEIDYLSFNDVMKVEGEYTMYIHANVTRQDSKQEISTLKCIIAECRLCEIKKTQANIKPL